MGLEFFEDGHRYELDGVVIPSVSRVCEPLSQKAYAEIPDYVLMRAAAKGTAVHEAIENYNLFGDYSIDSAYKGYVDGYIRWFGATKPEVMQCEVATWHTTMMYAGTVDMICKIDGVVTLVDFKTSAKVIDKSYRVQLEAYRQALKTHGVVIEKKMVLHLKANGVYEVVEYETEDTEAWTVFGGLKALYDYTR